MKLALFVLLYQMDTGSELFSDVSKTELTYRLEILNPRSYTLSQRSQSNIPSNRFCPLKLFFGMIWGYMLFFFQKLAFNDILNLSISHIKSDFSTSFKNPDYPGSLKPPFAHGDKFSGDKYRSTHTHTISSVSTAYFIYSHCLPELVLIDATPMWIHKIFTGYISDKVFI